MKTLSTMKMQHDSLIEVSTGMSYNVIKNNGGLRNLLYWFTQTMEKYYDTQKKKKEK